MKNNSYEGCCCRLCSLNLSLVMYKLIVILIPLLSQRHSQGFRDAISTECHLQSLKTGELVSVQLFLSSIFI